MREMYHCSLVCTYRKAFKNIKGKVDVQKGALGFKEKIDNKRASSIQFIFSFIVVIWE
jgi:hypothetical protein